MSTSNLYLSFPVFNVKGFQKNNHPISTLAKVILSLSKNDFCGSGTGKPAQIILRQAQGDFSLDTDADTGRF
jgi:hypothetical protein